jgi:hypothetical protein
MFNQWVRISILSTAVAALFVATATAQSRRPAVNSGKALEDPAAATSYWTEERLRSAVPLETPSISQSELQELLTREKPPLAPAPPTELPGRDLKLLGIPSGADVAEAPYKHAGRLYFTLNGGNYTCTAQFVGDSTVVMTAAHCVQDKDSGSWATNVLFHRAYKNNASEQQTAAVCLGTKAGWVTGGAGRYKWDYSFIKTKDSSKSGWLGLKVGLPYASWEAVGYPSNYGGGQVMQKVGGTKGVVGGGVAQMVGNPMRSGDSGGAWHVSGTSISLNSYHVEGNTADEWGPLFDSETLDLWKYALNGCT